MSYAGAAALQAGVYQWLTDWPALAGVPVVDAVPSGTAPDIYVLIGAEDARDTSDNSGAGAEHRLVLSVVSRAQGFAAAKGVAVSICDALAGQPPALARGRLVGMWFLQARAQRVNAGALRRIDLTFRARIEL